VLVGFWCSLLVEVLGGVATAGLLAALVAFREAANHIEAHDRTFGRSTKTSAVSFATGIAS
jgi:hypothetical protein